jgi:hypothetical protein
VKLLNATRGYLKKFEIRFLNPVPKQPMDQLLEALSKSSVLEAVEIDGPNLLIEDLVMIARNKQKGFKIQSHTTKLEAEEYINIIKEENKLLNHVELNVNIKYEPIKRTRHLINTMARLKN